MRYQILIESGVYTENCKFVQMSFYLRLELYLGLAFTKLLADMEDDHARFRAVMVWMGSRGVSKSNHPQKIA